MTPYYSDEWTTIYHADCRESLPPADVLVTDPPYGIDFVGKKTKKTKVKAIGGYTTGDDAEVGPAVVRVLIATVTRGVVFTGTRQLHAYPQPQDIGCVFCPSGAGIGNWGFTMFHPVLFYGTRTTSTCRPSSMQSFHTNGTHAEGGGHPCPKPVKWMTWAVSLASLPGETIIDPFMGSGTTLVAAKSLGQRAIGIEIEERYCEVAAKRLDQGVLDLGGAA